VLDALDQPLLVCCEHAVRSRVAARLHSSVQARTGRLPLRYRAEHAHYFDAQTGARI